MGIFSKKKKEEQGFFVNSEEDNIKISGDKNLAPHAITAEEVSALWVFNDEKEVYPKTSALDSLKKRMTAATKNEPVKEEKAINEEQDDVKIEEVAVETQPQTADVEEVAKTEEVFESETFTEDAADIPPSTEQIENIAQNEEPEQVSVLEEETPTFEAKPQETVDVLPEENDAVITFESDDPVTPKADIIPEVKETVAPQETVTLFEKVKRYTVDEDGHDVTENQQPIYELQSVADILKTNSEDAMKNLSQKYGVDFSFDNLGKERITDYIPDVAPQSVTPAKPKIVVPPIAPTPAFEKMVIDAEKHESEKLLKSLSQEEATEATQVIGIPHISDIDTHEVGVEGGNPISNTATIRFTPIKDSKGNTDRITISSVTKHIDLGDAPPEDISSHSTPELEKSEFDEFVPENEYVDTASGKKILVSLAKQKRFYFLTCVLSALCALVLSVFLLPPAYNTILSNPKNSLLVCTGILSLSVLANFNMFFDFKNILNKRSQFDILASLCAVLTMAFGVVSAFAHKSTAYYIILSCALILFFRVFFKFKAVSAKYISLRQILNDKPKNAVALINDPATTFAMAKNAIEGNVLVAATRKSGFIKDFMKHFDFHKTISGKASIVFITTLSLSLLCGFTAFFYYEKSLFYALFAATSISCFAAIPTAFFIDSLPLASAAKKLGSSFSMIAGIHGAEKIENANAAVININDIFPAGTITMHNMQVLSNNNIDEILLRAASLTAAVNSPLKTIFEKIAGTNSEYSIPDSDTVKYEKNLGISGWVDNEPMFIGNRSLMMAHGIEIPSLEIDKKILRKGYFPVYVATNNTACALIVIQYSVDPTVAKQLHKITDLGVLLLVENCDPNVTDQMLCDYFGLYDDSVKVMTNTGLHMYKNAVAEIPSCSAPAVYRGSGLNFIKIVNCASGIRKCNRLLTVLYTLFAIIGALYFVYAAFSGIISMPEPFTVLIYSLSTTILSIFGFLIRKP